MGQAGKVVPDNKDSNDDDDDDDDDKMLLCVLSKFAQWVVLLVFGTDRRTLTRF